MLTLTLLPMGWRWGGGGYWKGEDWGGGRGSMGPSGGGGDGGLWIGKQGRGFGVSGLVLVAILVGKGIVRGWVKLLQERYPSSWYALPG